MNTYKSEVKHIIIPVILRIFVSTFVLEKLNYLKVIISTIEENNLKYIIIFYSLSI